MSVLMYTLTNGFLFYGLRLCIPVSSLHTLIIIEVHRSGMLVVTNPLSFFRVISFCPQQERIRHVLLNDVVYAKSLWEQTQMQDYIARCPFLLNYG